MYINADRVLSAKRQCRLTNKALGEILDLSPSLVGAWLREGYALELELEQVARLAREITFPLCFFTQPDAAEKQESRGKKRPGNRLFPDRFFFDIG